MTWPLTWFFFSVKQKRTSESLSSHTETKGGSECFVQTFPVSHPATLLPTCILWPSLCMMGGCLLQGGPLSSFKWGTSMLFPLHLLACPPLPSLCQIPIYCLSSPNLFFFALLCDMGSGWDLDSVSISPLPAGFMLGFVSRGTELKGPCKAMEGEGVSFPISGVLIFSGAWLFVDYTQWHTQHPPRPPKRPYCGLAPTHSHTLPTGFPTARRPTSSVLCSPWQVSCVGHTAGCVFLQCSRTCLCRVWASSLEWRGGSSELSVPSSCAFPWPWMT